MRITNLRNSNTCTYLFQKQIQTRSWGLMWLDDVLPKILPVVHGICPGCYHSSLSLLTLTHKKLLALSVYINICTCIWTYIFYLIIINYYIFYLINHSTMTSLYSLVRIKFYHFDLVSSPTMPCICSIVEEKYSYH